MFPKLERGKPIPAKLWMRATDILSDSRTIGNQWVAAGKPKTGLLYDKFCSIESEYSQMADSIWFCEWTHDQREEWERIFHNTEGVL